MKEKVLLRRLGGMSFWEPRRGVADDEIPVAAAVLPPQDCFVHIVDPGDVERAAVLLAERGYPLTQTVFAQLGLSADELGRFQPFAERRHGVPCGQPDCIYGYVAVPLTSAHSIAAGVARRHGGRAMRCVVDIELNGALAVDCTDIRHLDERALRDNDPRAVAQLRALRQAGADIIWVRGLSASHVGVIFTQSIGSTIQIVGEAIYAERSNGDWVRLLATSAPAPAATAAKPGRSATRSHRPSLAFVLWQLLVALFCVIVAPPLVGLLGIEVSLPLWALLLVSLTLGWLIALTVAPPARRRLSPAPTAADPPARGGRA